jgi:cystathionine beta-lyase family protein involved in aluminum resistance
VSVQNANSVTVMTVVDSTFLGNSALKNTGGGLLLAPMSIANTSTVVQRCTFRGIFRAIG